MIMCKLWNSISNRWLYLAGALFAGGLMGFALYLQYVVHQDPCPLCMVQRVIFIALMAVFALAAVQGPKRTGGRIYAALIVLLSLTGVGVASRHIWIQHLPRDQVPACGPGWTTCWKPCRCRMSESVDARIRRMRGKGLDFPHAGHSGVVAAVLHRTGCVGGADCCQGTYEIEAIQTSRSSRSNCHSCREGYGYPLRFNPE